ncbi:hypothetical protein FKM82_012788 [Ascaphus truei]
MNWVGGSRNRIIFKQERRKQKEFFERKKLKSKLKLLNSTSPKSSSFSLDLLNLYVVNQIASKKEITNTKAVHVDMSRGTTFPVGRHNVELPMSPTTVPSKICLEDCEINGLYSVVTYCFLGGPYEFRTKKSAMAVFNLNKKVTI